MWPFKKKTKVIITTTERPFVTLKVKKFLRYEEGNPIFLTKEDTEILIGRWFNGEVIIEPTA
jgi:hypothetical protein